MHQRIPEGRYGQAEVRKIDNVTWLYCGDQPLMCDTATAAAESFIRMAYGDVLVAGMGLNIIPLLLAAKPQVTSVTIVESHPDVIAMCRRHAWHPKFRSVFKDIWYWTPGQIFDFAYFDIWLHATDEAIEEAHRLQRQFGPWAEWLANWPELQAEVASHGGKQ